MPASANRRGKLWRKQRVRDDRHRSWSRRRRCSALAQAISVPPEETISSTIRAGRPAMQCRVRAKRFRPSDRRGGSFAQRSWRQPSRPARSLTQGRDSASGPTTTVAGSRPVCAQTRRRWPAWPTDCRPRCRETRRSMSAVRCRCASTVIDAIDDLGEQLADDLLADRFAVMEGGVLPHVAEIGRQQHQPLGAVRAAALRRRTAARSACRSAGRASA